MTDITSIVDILFDPTEATIEYAAKILHDKIKGFDSVPIQNAWMALSDRERDFYRLSVKAVLKAVADVYAAAIPKIAL